MTSKVINRCNSIWAVPISCSSPEAGTMPEKTINACDESHLSQRVTGVMPEWVWKVRTTTRANRRGARLGDVELAEASELCT